MQKKIYKLLSLFLAVAMLATSMPANSVCAVETDNDEVIEDSLTEAINDDEEIDEIIEESSDDDISDELFDDEENDEKLEDSSDDISDEVDDRYEVSAGDGIDMVGEEYSPTFWAPGDRYFDVLITADETEIDYCEARPDSADQMVSFKHFWTSASYNGRDENDDVIWGPEKSPQNTVEGVLQSTHSDYDVNIETGNDWCAFYVDMEKVPGHEDAVANVTVDLNEDFSANYLSYCDGKILVKDSGVFYAVYKIDEQTGYVDGKTIIYDSIDVEDGASSLDFNVKEPGLYCVVKYRPVTSTRKFILKNYKETSEIKSNEELEYSGYYPYRCLGYSLGNVEVELIGDNSWNRTYEESENINNDYEPFILSGHDVNIYGDGTLEILGECGDINAGFCDEQGTIYISSNSSAGYGIGPSLYNITGFGCYNNTIHMFDSSELDIKQSRFYGIENTYAQVYAHDSAKFVMTGFSPYVIEGRKTYPAVTVESLVLDDNAYAEITQYEFDRNEANTDDALIPHIEVRSHSNLNVWDVNTATQDLYVYDSNSSVSISARKIGVNNQLIVYDSAGVYIYAGSIGVNKHTANSCVNLYGGYTMINSEYGQGSLAPVTINYSEDKTTELIINTKYNCIHNNLKVNDNDAIVDICSEKGKAVTGTLSYVNGLYLLEGESEKNVMQVSKHNAANKYIHISNQDSMPDCYMQFDTSGGEFKDPLFRRVREIKYGEAFGEKELLPTSNDLKEWIGHKFIGWFRRADGLDRKLGAQVTDDTVFKGIRNVELIAGWEKLPVDVYLDANGGVVTNDVSGGEVIGIKVPYGDKLDLDPNSIYHPQTATWFNSIGRKGYKFLGWCEDVSGNDTIFTSYRMPKTGADSMDAKTFYAIWDKEYEINAPKVVDVNGNVVEKWVSKTSKPLPKNSKLYLSSTITINGNESKADNNDIAVYYRVNNSGDYKLYKGYGIDDFDEDGFISIQAFAVEKSIINADTVSVSELTDYISDIVQFNDGEDVRYRRETTNWKIISAEDDEYKTEDALWLGEASYKTVEYDGKAKTPTVSVYYDNQKLVEKKDYTISYENNVNAASSSSEKAPAIVVTFKGDYTGKLKRTFSITPVDGSKVSAAAVTALENGKVQAPKSTVTYTVPGTGAILKLVEGKDFVYDYSAATGVDRSETPITDSENLLKIPGKYKIPVVFVGDNLSPNYVSSTEFDFEILEADTVYMSKTSIKLAKSSINYKDFEDPSEEKLPGTITVKDGTKVLEEGNDYTVSYKNNVSAGTATVIIKGTGNISEVTNKRYYGEKTATYTIKGTALSSAKFDAKVIPSKISVSAISFPYEPLNDTNDDSAVYVVVSRANVGLSGIDKSSYYEAVAKEEDTSEYDYYYEYDGDTSAPGKVNIILTGVNGFTGTKKISYQVTPIAFNAANVTCTLDKENYRSGAGDKLSIVEDYGDWDTFVTYNEHQKRPNVIVKTNDGTDTELEYGTDFTLVYGENINAGKNKGNITVKGLSIYSGSVKMQFNIEKFDLLSLYDGVADESLGDFPYEKGGVVIPPLSSRVFTFVEGRDYKVAYKNNNKIGTATATITGNGNFTGKVAVTYDVVAKDLDAVNITATDIVAQNKAGICKPKVTITDVNGKALASKVDYDPNFVYTYNKATEVKQITKVGKTSVEKTIIRSAGDLVDLKKDVIPANAEIRLTVTAEPNDKYAGAKCYKGSSSAVFRFVAKDIAKATVKVVDQEKTGQPIYIDKSMITITMGKNDIIPDDCYEIIGSSYKNNVKKGKASVTIRGVGEYGGTKVINFNIVNMKAK